MKNILIVDEVDKVARNLAIHLYSKKLAGALPRLDNREELTKFLYEALSSLDVAESHPLIAQITIPKYKRRYTQAESMNPKYFEKGKKKLPNEYCDPHLLKVQGVREPDWSKYMWKAFPCVRQHNKVLVDFLVHVETEAKVIANEQYVGKPRIIVINGQKIYNGAIRTFDRNNMIGAIKDQMRQFTIAQPQITSYPIRIVVECHDTIVDEEFSNKMKWDLGNRIFPYNKAFEDVLTDKDSKVIVDDSIYYLTGPPAPLFFPVEKAEDRKLVYKIYLDRRPIITNNEFYKKKHGKNISK